MKIFRTAAVLSLSVFLAGPMIAQETHEDMRKQTKAEKKQQEKEHKAQAKADKEAKKLADSGQAKDAARAQDKADQVKGQTPPQ